jgi:non-specific serine/threonine protein kinase
VGNLRAALAWAAERGAQGDPVPGLRLTTALVPFWSTRAELTEGRVRLATALAATPAGPAHAALRLRALVGAGRLAYQQADYAAAAALHLEALAEARARDDAPVIAAALNELGMVRRLQRDLDSAARHLEEALARFRALGDRHGTAHALLNLGSTARVAGDTARATRLLTESLELFREIGDLRYIAIARSMLGLAAAQAGDHPLAATHFAASLVAHRELGDRWFVVFDLLGLAAGLFAQGRRGEAARLLGAAEALGAPAGADLAGVGNVTYASFLAEAEACLREAPFAAAWAEGRALPLDRAVAYALALAGGMAAPPPAPSRPAATGLTRREREVALLLARGQSDREIASTLSISPATASLHVHRILEKLALRSRHQVADWAATQDVTTSPHG